MKVFKPKKCLKAFKNSPKSLEIDFDTPSPNKIVRTHENISTCRKNRLSSRKMEFLEKYRKFPKHSNRCINMF